MSQGFFCDGINSLVNAMWELLNIFLSLLNFTGASALDVPLPVGSYLGCNL